MAGLLYICVAALLRKGGEVGGDWAFAYQLKATRFNPNAQNLHVGTIEQAAKPSSKTCVLFH